ncbi:GNAT family N-acetyltransferase [Leptolyngbya iicbica]|uniref:GNAT family N-acetyltransferase n=2 Tax=Cyanophyceae TaxID=3028117 RepID=A0A4Q7E5F9_9CYAN|nr:GNAT family N-acetyltransferase [Leptolyngbya sp. LK]RZM77299.1 GNAT family N-acetyltransferase [Leptolyngbya sp. LK]
MVTTLSVPLTQPKIITRVIDYNSEKTLIHKVRTEVFVHEQKIPAHLEIDDLDNVSQHVLATYGGHAVGAGRLTPHGRIGRVAVSRPLRRQGVGQQIMALLLELAQRNHYREVVLSAQHHAIAFYEKLGFECEGEEFLEVGIWHVTMRKQMFLC